MVIGIDRRTIIASAAAAALAESLPVRADTPRARIPFGAAVNHEILPADGGYRAALVRHCDLLVGEGAMKWIALRQSRERFDFKLGDDLVTFATSHGLAVRGHTLIWNEGNPAWLKSLASADEAERELRQHVERVVQHFAGSIRSWDVVNEPIADRPRNSMDLRDGPWSTWLGERHIDLAFRVAHAVAPDQQRVLNEYGIEHATAKDRLKRAAFKRLILDMKARDVPITAVGLQGHLDGAKDIDAEGVAAFCAEMTRAGLDVVVTELDVNDVALAADPVERDRIVADKTRTFLKAVLAGCRPTAVCTWGISDRYTWMPMWNKRADGLTNRPLPLDRNFEQKPMMTALSSLLKG